MGHRIEKSVLIIEQAGGVRGLHQGSGCRATDFFISPRVGKAPSSGIGFLSATDFISPRVGKYVSAVVFSCFEVLG